MYSPTVQSVQIAGAASPGAVAAVLDRRMNGMNAEHLANSPADKAPMHAASVAHQANSSAGSKPIMKPPKKRRAPDCDQEAAAQLPAVNGPSPPASKVSPPVTLAFDLSEWRNHRVLARQGRLYLPGTIVSAAAGCGVVAVRFDAAAVGGRTVDYDVCGRSTDVVSDCAPSAPAVGVGSRVCVRTDPDGVAFETGWVRERRATAFRVELEDVAAAPSSAWVCRAQLRLLQAPWYEDEEEAEVASRRL